MNHTVKHNLTIADCLTTARMAGTAALAFLRPLSPAFFFVYALTGLTDVLDGWIARATHTASDFGAKLDSAADLLFYAVMLLRVFPALWYLLPKSIWYLVAVIVGVRILAYLTAAAKYHRFAALHTYLNKLTGLAVFLVPFLMVTPWAEGYCWAVTAVAAAASLEELAIHLQKQTYRADTKSIFANGMPSSGGISEYEHSCF